MRKGYGPTGMSFDYPFDLFKRVVERDGLIRVMLVFKGAEKAVIMDDMQDMSDRDMLALYDSIDCSEYDDEGRYYLIYVN